MLERLMDEVDDDEMDKFDPMVDVWRKCIGKGKKIWWEDMFNDDVHGREVEEIPEEDPSPREASMAEENAAAPPRQASPAAFPGVAEIIESVELLRKQLTDGLKDISEKLDAQDKRIIAVEAFVKNAQSIPDMDGYEWRGNDGYDFSFDRAAQAQGEDTAPAPMAEDTAPAPMAEDTAPAPMAEDTAPAPMVEDSAPAPMAEDTAPAPKVADIVAEEGEEETIAKEAEEEAGTVAEEGAEESIVKEAEEEAGTVAEASIGKEEEAGTVAEEESIAEPSVMESIAKRTPSIVVKRGNLKLKILSSKKKRTRRPSRFKKSPYSKC